MGRSEVFAAGEEVSPALAVVRYRPHMRESVGALLARPLASLYPGGASWLDQRLNDVERGLAESWLIQTASGAQVAAVAIETPKSANIVKLSTLYVAPSMRGLGLGRTLLRHISIGWDRRHVDEIYLTAATSVVPELAPLLRRHGFLHIATEIDRYGPGRDEAVFVLALPQGISR